METVHPPPSLRRAIQADLAPVRPLPTPSRRVLRVVPFAILLPLMLPALGHLPPGLRHWSPLLAGTFALECGLAVAAVTLLLRDVVPGQAVGRGKRLLIVAASLAGPVLLAILLALVTPSRLPDRLWGRLTLRCFTTSAVDALPVLATLLVLAWRGLVRQPARVGALAGLAAGILAEAARRGYCTTSQPSHVLIGHLSAICATVIVGTLTATLIGLGQRRL